MLARSDTFVGEWPAGTHWHPGEVREVVSLEDAPAGLVPQVAPVVVKPAAKGKGTGKAAAGGPGGVA